MWLYWGFSRDLLATQWRLAGDTVEAYWRLSGDYWRLSGDLLATQWRRTGDLVETYWGFSGDLLGIQWRLTEDSVKTYWRLTGDLLETQWRLTGDSVKTHSRLSWNSSLNWNSLSTYLGRTWNYGVPSVSHFPQRIQSLAKSWQSQPKSHFRSVRTYRDIPNISLFPLLPFLPKIFSELFVLIWFSQMAFSPWYSL